VKELMCNWQQQQQQAKKNIAFTCKIEKVKNASIFLLLFIIWFKFIK